MSDFTLEVLEAHNVAKCMKEALSEVQYGNWLVGCMDNPNMDEEMFDIVWEDSKGEPRGVLISCFFWEDSDEGAEYWADVSAGLGDEL
jgi:hypothetical protein